MTFSLKSKKVSTFYVTVICSSVLETGFLSLMKPISDLKLILFFNTSVGFTLTSLKFLNKFIESW